MNAPDQAKFARAFVKYEASEPRGALLSITELRERAKMPDPDFDRIVLDLAERGRVTLHHHDYAMGMKPSARSKLVRKGDVYFIGIARRDPKAPLFDETKPAKRETKAPRRTTKRATRAPRTAKVATKGPEVLRRRPSGHGETSLQELAHNLVTSRTPALVRRALREQGAELKARRRAAVAAARAECRSGRATAQARAKKRREAILAAWHKHQEAQLHRVRTECAQRRRLIEQTYGEKEGRQRALKRLVAEELAQLKATKKRHLSTAQLHGQVRAAQRKSETIEHVRREVEHVNPSLLPYFELVKGRLKSSPKKSRAELFFEMAEANPEAALLASERSAEKQIAHLLEHGEDRWTQAAKRLEVALCKSANRAAKKGTGFKFEKSQLEQMKKLGIDPGVVMQRCYIEPRNKRLARRIVSGRAQRHEEAPF